MSQPADTIPDQGTLDELPLPVLLLRLYRRRYSGALRVLRDGVEKRVQLRDGVPVMAESNLASESLGVQLMDAGRLSRDDYVRVVEAVRKRKCKEGAALLGLELVAPRELYDALKQQVRRRLLDCLGWSRGSFELAADATPVEDASAFRCDPIPLVQEAVAIHWSPTVLRDPFAAHRDRFAGTTARTEALLTRLHRDGELDRFVAALDGGDSLATLLDAVRAPTALAALWVLDAAGGLVYRDEPPPGGDAAAESSGPQIEVFVRESSAAAPTAGAAPRPAPAPAAAARPAPPAAERDALARELRALHDGLGERDHYQLLGVGPNADAAAVRRAYVGLAKRVHPDAITRHGHADLRDVAEVVFGRIAEAHEVLADPERRRDYDRAREQGGGEDVDVARVVQAEALYRRAEILLRGGNFAGALEFLRPAVAAWPDECAYQSALGWALYKKSPPDPKGAREHLEKAIALDRDDAVAHFRLGVVLRSLGDGDAAETALSRAKRLDPKVRS